MYGEGYAVLGNGDFLENLQAAIGRLPEFAPYKPPPTNRNLNGLLSSPPLERHIGEGSFFVGDDLTICQSLGGESVPVRYGGTVLRANGTQVGKRISSLIRIRDLARRVLESQNDGWPEGSRVEARRDLNRAYDLFVFSYGPINKTTFHETKSGHVIRRMPNLGKFREDPDAMLVMSLEDYDDVTGKAAKAAIMEKDVVGKTPPITHVENSEEGLLVSLNQRGIVDLPFISTLYGKPEDEIIKELDGLIFLDPESQNWQTADAYLSGNVRAKLAAAETGRPLLFP